MVVTSVTLTECLQGQQILQLILFSNLDKS